jgi:hypothetical protein
VRPEESIAAERAACVRAIRAEADNYENAARRRTAGFYSAQNKRHSRAQLVEVDQLLACAKALRRVAAVIATRS